MGHRFLSRGVASFAVMALVAGGAFTLGATTLATSAGAAITTWGPVDPTIPSGDANSLWDILENKIGDGDTVVLQAGATYTFDNCEDPDPDIEKSVTIQGNGATIRMGCVTTEEVLDIDAGGPVSIDAVTITRAPGKGGGPGIRVGDVSTLTITNSAIVDNVRCTGSGGGIYFSADDAKLVVVNSTIAGNYAKINGGGIAQDGGPSDILVVNSTISNNSASYVGGIQQDEGDVILVYSDVVDNTTGATAPAFCGSFTTDSGASDDAARPADQGDVHGSTPVVAPANVRVRGALGALAVTYDKLTSFGSVIALPHGGANCGTGSAELANTVSQGYNFADDTSCAFTAGTDKQGTGAAFDPKLDPLAGNGGLGQTRLPQAGSPLIDAIPTAACSGGDALAGSAITTDQRRLTRPDVVSQQCDIGAVELQTELPPVIRPTFTG